MILCDFLHIFSSWSSLNFLNLWFYSIQEIWGKFGHYLFHYHLCSPINSSGSLITNGLEQFNIVPQVNSALFFSSFFVLYFILYIFHSYQFHLKELFLQCWTRYSLKYLRVFVISNIFFTSREFIFLIPLFFTSQCSFFLYLLDYMEYIIAVFTSFSVISVISIISGSISIDQLF